MITEVFPIELAGVKYRIAEDMEQAGYTLHRQPLRAPFNGFIQGDSGRFQLRSDILEWSLTDWSGGEGYLVFDSENPNRYSIGYNIDPLKVPGTLRLSGLAQEVLVQAASTAMHAGELVLARDDLYFVDGDGSATLWIRQYDSANNEWDPTDSHNFASGTPEGRGAAGYSQRLYVQMQNGIVARWDGTTVDNLVTLGDWLLGILNSRIYWAVNDSTGVIVREGTLLGSGGQTGTNLGTLVDLGTSGSAFGARISTAFGLNRMYIAGLSGSDETIVYELVPTTAAGAGFINELFRVKGFRTFQALFIAGLLYLAGMRGTTPTILQFDPVTEEFEVLYSSPTRSVAHVNSPSPAINEGGGDVDGVGLATGHLIMMGGPNFTNGREWQVMTIDSGRGAVVGGTVIDASTSFTGATVTPFGRHTVALFEGATFVCICAPETGGSGIDLSRTWRIHPTLFTTNTGILDSAVNDFSVADEKILLSITVNTEPLPANARVVVKYQLDQDGVWLTAGTHDTDGSSSATFTISTASTTRSFRNLQIRLELDNNSTNTVTPVIQNVRVHATVVRGVRVWDLLLDATDEDAQLQDRSWNGATLISNITNAGDMGDVISFKDGYRDRLPNGFSTHDVVVDEYRVFGDRPGEGYISVRLREVIST